MHINISSLHFAKRKLGPAFIQNRVRAPETKTDAIIVKKTVAAREEEDPDAVGAGVGTHAEVWRENWSAAHHSQVNPLPTSSVMEQTFAFNCRVVSGGTMVELSEQSALWPVPTNAIKSTGTLHFTIHVALFHSGHTANS
mmetsp:Transcript_25697/g.43669  ORF Transcript_25697/g.43669 Transcript_25697/m.43669 type:complete len:140 (-) Transcript_25697:301-720(-)